MIMLYIGLKWHASDHFPYEIVVWGSPRNFDTISSEKAHKKVKKAFKKTSGRLDTTKSEIIGRIETNEVLDEVVKQGIRLLGEDKEVLFIFNF
jgi:hypothetical protein